MFHPPLRAVAYSERVEKWVRVAERPGRQNGVYEPPLRGPSENTVERLRGLRRAKRITMTLFAISVMMFWMLLSIPSEAWENPSAGVYIGGLR